MFDFKELTKRYKSEAAFNKMTNLFQQLIEEYGFSPSEIRQGLFLAQYNFEMGNAREIIRTQKEWEAFYEIQRKMQNMILVDFEELKKQMSILP